MFVQQLGLLMTTWQPTTFLLCEYFNDNDPTPVFAVADGLIWPSLAEGARLGVTGLVVALEHRPQRERSPRLLGLIQRGVVGWIDSHAPDLSIDEVVMLILAEVRRLQASRVVLDRLSGLELALAPTFQPDFRESLPGLVDALATAGVTVVMTQERVMAVVKVHASAHCDELRSYSVGEDGIRMNRTLPEQAGLLRGRPTRKRPPPDGG